MPRQYTPRADVSCAHCARMFTVKASHADRARFCSMECRNAARARIPRSCQHCGSTFLAVPNEAPTARFCGMACRKAARGRVTLTCGYCERLFKVVQSQSQRLEACSLRCRSALGWNRGNVKPAEERFWRRVDKNGPLPDHQPSLGRCWVWTGARNRDGRGTFSFSGHSRLAHQFAYLLEHGSLPGRRLEVTHLCDNGRLGCVRASHLMADTHQGNMRAAVERGIVRRGERVASAKLTEAQVRDIRARYDRDNVTMIGLAREHGVSADTIREIITRVTWRHVP